MLSSLFRPRWQSKDPEQRLSAIAQLDPSSSKGLAALQALLDDSDSRIRRAALDKLPASSASLGALLTEKRVDMRQALLSKLFSQPDDRQAVQQQAKALGLDKQTDQLRTVMGYSQNTQLSLYLAELLDDEATWLSLALHHKSHQLRRQAAEKLQSESSLQSLSKQSSDKSISRFARERLDEQKAQIAQIQARDAEYQSLLSKIEALIDTVNTSDLSQRWQHLRTTWQRLAEQAHPEEAEHYQRLAPLVEQRLQALHSQTSAQTQAEQPSQNESIAATTAEADPALAKPTHEPAASTAAPTAVSEPPMATAPEDPLHSALKVHTQQRPALRANATALATAQEWLSQAQALIAQAAKSHPEASEQLRAQASAVAEQIELTQAQLLIDTRFRKGLGRLKRAIDERQLRSANRAYLELQQLLEDTPAPQASHWQKRIEKLKPGLDELIALHEFVAGPKKAELIEQAEQLQLDTALAAEDRLEQLKALRAEWKLLSHANDTLDAQQQRFNQVADDIYASCEPYLAEQRQLKSDNLARRQALCDELDTLLKQWQQSEQPDGNRLQQCLKESKTRWKQYQPVSFKAAKSCQKQFDQQIKQLNALLNTCYERNAAKRQQLIEQAKTLESLPLEQAIDTAKALQEAWKSAAPTRSSEYRQQWETFRPLLDAVFANREQERQSQSAQGQQLGDELNQTLQQLDDEHGQPLSQDTLDTYRQLLEQAKAQATALQQLSGAKARGPLQVIQRHQQALDHFEKTEPLRQQQQQHQRFFALCAEHHQWQLAKQPERSPAEQTELDEAINALPKHFAQALQTPLDSHTASSEPNGAAGQQQREQLLVELEVLADIPSPETAQAERRAYQLRCLEQAQRPDLAEKIDQLEAYLLQWLAADPVANQADYTALAARFESAMAHIWQQELSGVDNT